MKEGEGWVREGEEVEKGGKGGWGGSGKGGGSVSRGWEKKGDLSGQG